MKCIHNVDFHPTLLKKRIVMIFFLTETYLQMNFPNRPSKRKSDDELSSLMEDSYYPFLGQKICVFNYLSKLKENSVPHFF